MSRWIVPVVAVVAVTGAMGRISPEEAPPQAVDAPATNRVDTIGPLPAAADGLETGWVRVEIDAADLLGPFPPLQGDLSQGAETGDPNYFEEMEPLVAELRPGVIRVSPFAVAGLAVSTDEQGRLVTDFSWGDRIIASLRRAGAEICWNCASWPEEMKGDRYPRDLDLFEEFVRRVVERYNGDGQRDIHYIEFWNEPPSFYADGYDAMVRGAHAADPGVKVGAPAVMDLNDKAIDQALRHAAEGGSPVDFISFHLYGKAPWDWPGYLERAQELLDRYPGFEKTEMLITEWGLDAGESGVCDTPYDAAYYCSVLEQTIPWWPQVRPCYFEIRDGWDWKGPSRDLFGRWGMVTYSNLVPKPVFQAARMWALMGDERVAATSTDPRIHVLASRRADAVTILAWSFPRDLWLQPPNSPLLFAPSQLDLPVEITVRGIPFDSPGLEYERYQVDFLHSNVNAGPERTGLEKVHEVVLARRAIDDVFQVPVVVPLHGVTLLVLRPAERAPADVGAETDRYQIWAGERARIRIAPRTDETFAAEYIVDPIGDPGWDVQVVGRDPLELEVAPRNPALRANRFFTAWIRRPDWGAWGRAIAEFRTDNPLECVRESWRIDLDAITRSGDLAIPFRNRSDRSLPVRFAWTPEAGVKVTDAMDHVELPAGDDGVATARIVVDDGLPPGRYLLRTVPNTGVDLEPVETEIFLPMAAMRFPDPPTIDGRLDEWVEAQRVEITGADRWDGHHASRYTGPDDLHGVLQAGWDDEALYLAVEVVDDDHYAPVDNRVMHQFDCLHVGFDLRRDMLDRREFFYEDDCDYLFTYTDHGCAYRHWGAKRAEEIPEKVRVGAVRDGNRIRYEIALPWEEEFVPYAGPDPGRVIGFSLYLRDIDPDEEQGFLAWGRGLDWHTKRPALFWSLQLVE